MKAHITNLMVGDKLISDVFNHFGLHVLSAGATISENDIGKLFRHNIEYVDIAFRHVEEDPVYYASPQMKAITEEIQPQFDRAVACVKSLFEQVWANGKIDDQLIKENFDPLIEQFKKESDIVSLLIALNNRDDYTYQHSVQVGMLSYYISKWNGHPEEVAYVAGKAGFLHDIGKSKIPDNILQKPDRLTPEEYEEIKKHTVFGYEILEESLHNKALSLVALEHHERIDGGGYPNGIDGSKMHPLSKIVAVADVYSAMISSRVYQKKRDLLVVLKEMHNLSFTQFDPKITQTFIRHMLPCFVGKRVSLKDGRIGSIVMMNPVDLFHPLIRIDDQFVDLAHEKPELREIDMIYL